MSESQSTPPGTLPAQTSNSGTEKHHLIHQDNGAPSKKPRNSAPASPTKVLHVRNLPMGFDDARLLSYVNNFGRAINWLTMPNRQQALVEMGSIAEATSIINHQNAGNYCIMDDRQVMFQYSNHDQLSVQPNNNGIDQQRENRILHISFSNVKYPINVDVLHQVFSPYGPVLRAFIFMKAGNVQALYEFASIDSARRAKIELDGRNIYNGCCTMRITFSTLPELSVKYNNARSRDYTDYSLPFGPVDRTQGQLAAAGLAGVPQPGGFTNGPHGSSAQGAMHGLGGQTAQFGMGSAPGTMGVGGTAQNGQQTGGLVLIAGRLPRDVTCDKLFTLFGLYGDVQRVKILYGKTDTALVQMMQPQQTALAIQYLHNVAWGSSPITVSMSRHQSVVIRHDAGEDPNYSHLTKDYSNHSRHRFRVPGNKNFRNIAGPSSVLHLSGLPEAIDDETVQNTFTPHGKVVSFKRFTNDPKMAIIQFASIPDAVNALVNMDGHEFPGSVRPMRCAFSKSRHVNANAGQAVGPSRGRTVHSGLDDNGLPAAGGQPAPGGVVPGTQAPGVAN